MWQQFTEASRKVVFFAQEEAGALGVSDVDTEHFLLGLLRDENSAACQILGTLGVSVDAVRAEVERLATRHTGRLVDNMGLTPSAKKVIDFAYIESLELNGNFVGTEHLLVGVFRADGLGSRVLTALGVNLEQLRAEAAKVQHTDATPTDPSDIEKKRTLAAEILARQGRPPSAQQKAGWQRFNENARSVVVFAQEEAAANGENYVCTEHLLLGIVRKDDTVAVRILNHMGLSSARIRSEIERRITRGQGRLTQDMQLTPRAKRVINLAYDEARNLKNNYIGTEHLLLGLLSEEEGLAGKVLVSLGADIEVARAEVRKL